MLRTVAADSARPRDAAQAALDQGDLGAVHRHVGAASHGDANVGAGQRRGVVDAVGPDVPRRRRRAPGIRIRPGPPSGFAPVRLHPPLQPVHALTRGRRATVLNQYG
jgi:hypothetical protein